MRNPLFHDGWREPSEDGYRMLYYLSWVLGFLAGFSLLVYSVGLIFKHGVIEVETWPGYRSSIPGLPIWLLILGALTMLRAGMKLYPEIRRVRKKHLTADSLVAGGLLAGFALIVLGIERIIWAEGQPTAVASLVILGVIVLALSLLSGLAAAYWPKIKHLPKTVPNTTVTSRYGIDKKLMEIYDHPNPVEEGCMAMVELKTPDGQVLTLRAGSVAYDLAAPGMRGTARIAGSRLKSFQPTRRA